MKAYVEIVKYGDPDEVVKRMGPYSGFRAENIQRGASINLNHEEYFVRIVEDDKEKK